MTLLDTVGPRARPDPVPPHTHTRLSVVSETTAPSLADPGRLLELSAAGDLDAFGRFYDLMAPRVYGLTLRILRDPGYAEETVQEVFLQIWKQSSGYSPTLGSVQSWVLTIAHRRAVDRVRSESSATRRDEADAAAGAAHSDDIAEEVADKMAREEDVTAVRHCLGTLTENQRQSIEMAYFSGLTYREVADQLGAALPTIKSRIRDGLRRLKTCLGGELS